MLYLVQQIGVKMSTNFYWKHNIPDTLILASGEQHEYSVDDMDPTIHIGKRVWKGTGKKCSFTWAQQPEKVWGVCRENADAVVIYDEYKDEYTGQGFLDMLADCCDEDTTDMIGQWFC
jgi:hypothetical protein